MEAKEQEQVLVYGAGAHAKVVLATIEAEGKHEIIGLLDDDELKHGTTLYGYKVLGGRNKLRKLKNQEVSKVVLAIGDNVERSELAQLLLKYGFQLVTTIHPKATLLRGSSIGPGTVILPNAYIGPDVTVGGGVIISVGVIVGHDSVIGSWAQLCPNASLGGQVKLGDYSFIGMGASVLSRVTLGRHIIVGAGAAVIEDLPDHVTAIGVPSRVK